MPMMGHNSRNFSYVEDYFPQPSLQVDYNGPSAITISHEAHLHVDPVTGSDSNKGVFRDQPLATIRQALEIASHMVWRRGVLGQLTIHLGAGTHVVPGGFNEYNWPFGSPAGFDTINIYAEDDVAANACFVTFNYWTTGGFSGIPQIAVGPAIAVNIYGFTVLCPNGSEHPVICTRGYLSIGNVIFKPSTPTLGFGLRCIAKCIDGAKVTIENATYDFSLGGVPQGLIQSRNGANVTILGTSTIIGAPALSTGVYYLEAGSVIVDTSTWTGTATGPRFSDAGGGNILALPGASQAGLPGTTNGVLKTGSVLATSN